jgi:hypothetical protein
MRAAALVMVLLLGPAVRANAAAPQRDPLAALLSWFKDGSRGIIYDRRCRDLPLKRKGGVLVATVNVTTQTSGRTKTVRSQELIVGADLVLTDGSSVEYERSGDRWIEVSSGGFGDARALGYRLSNVNETAAWFSLITLPLGGAPSTMEAPHPFFFRTTTACAEYLREHPVSQADESSWR